MVLARPECALENNKEPVLGGIYFYVLQDILYIIIHRY